MGVPLMLPLDGCESVVSSTSFAQTEVTPDWTPSSLLLSLPPPPIPPPNNSGSTFGNKGAWAAAVAAVDPAEGTKVEKERSWRQQYTKYIVKQVQLGLKSPKNAVSIAQGGLDYCYQNFEFIRDGQTYKLGEALEKFGGSHAFETGVIKGDGKLPKFGPECQVPYQKKVLKGEALKAQLDKWASYGTIEPSARDAISYLVDNPNVLDLSDKYFVLLGAGSAMGPFLTLLSLGANIIAIDLDRQGIWERLIRETRNSPGTLIFPLKKKQSTLKSDADIAAQAGGNLFTDTPEIRAWLMGVEKGKDFVVGAYAYLDGELHVKVSLAMDAIIRDLTRVRKATPAYLCTPTDVHVITKEAHDAAEKEFKKINFTNVVSKLSPFALPGTGYLVKNALPPVKAEDGEELYLVDGIVGRQGPNYALAKRIQHWRAVVAREVDKVNVSSNIAPSTATVSVTSNKLFALAYQGFHFFAPLEVFQQETSNAVMAAMLIHDIRNPKVPSNPKNKLRNPLELFTYGSLHGGVWRMAYKIDSIGEPAAFLYLFTTPLGMMVVVAFWAVVIGLIKQYAGF